MKQLAFPFARNDEDECDVIARMLTARIVNVIQATASEGFRWSEGADIAISRVRADIAEDLRTLLKEATSADFIHAPGLCEDCGVNHADHPSRLCPGCEAYGAHQR